LKNFEELDTKSLEAVNGGGIGGFLAGLIIGLETGLVAGTCALIASESKNPAILWKTTVTVTSTAAAIGLVACPV